MAMSTPEITAGPLAGVRVLDLSRVLAGPTCTQVLGDLGADVIKVEKPGVGDDTRSWGPPYVVGPDGSATSESAYYLAANRNKRSVCIDVSTPDGRDAVLSLLQGADVLVENLKTGGLGRYGLSFEALNPRFPRLIYCSITGFGQTGPYARRPGYDFLAQAMGGIMSLTGDPEGPPMKVGVGIADVTCGLYATIGILAALRHRSLTGQGQQVDVSLLDTQVSWLVNEATNYFVSGTVPPRRGNEHPNIVPYSAYATADGHIVVAVGNDEQFARWCAVVGQPNLAEDPRFRRNSDRVRNREAFTEVAVSLMGTRPTGEWMALLQEAEVPCSPVNDLADVFDDPQVQARGMRVRMSYPLSGSGVVDLLGSPLNLSTTPVTYRLPPPTLGEHTQAVLRALAQDPSLAWHT